MNANTLLPRQARAAFALVLCLASLPFSTAGAQKPPPPLITIRPGDLPIILSAPHGGRSPIPGVPSRTGENVARFVPLADTNTDLLTEQLSDALEKETGKRPYVVIARFHRKFLDANRPPEQAYESEDAKILYDAYHKALSVARQDVERRWGRGLLLDIHGQAAEAKAVIRGTRNGTTTRHLVTRFGREALTGKDGLFGQMARQGLQVIPETGSDDKEHPKYNGGYIVQTHGSAKGGTIDALQLELGRDLRAPGADTATRIARALTAYSKTYLPARESEPDDTIGLHDDLGAGGRKQDRNLEEAGREKIRAFIRDGGGFIDI